MLATICRFDSYSFAHFALSIIILGTKLNHHFCYKNQSLGGINFANLQHYTFTLKDLK